MGITDYLQIARRRWLVLVVCAVVGVLSAAAYSATRDVEYSSTSQLYVATSQQSGQSDPLQGLQAAQQRLVSYASLANGQAVTQAVIGQLGLDATPSEIGSRISVEYPPGTVLMNITTTGDSADEAQQLNGAVDEQLQALVRRLEPTPSGGTPQVTLAVVNPPSEGSAGGSGTALYLLLGLVAGLVVGGLIAFVRDRTQSTVVTADALGRALGGPVVGPVQALTATGTDVRTLRAKLLAALDSPTRTRTVLVTGLGGDSAAVAVALASAMANAGKRTILVQATEDSVQRQSPGLSDVLWGRLTAGDLVERSGGGNLITLAPGDLSGSTVDLLASDAFGDVLDDLAVVSDVVVVHTGELTTSPESISIARHGVSAVIVVRLSRFSRSEIVAGTSDIRASAASTIGVAVGPAADAGGPRLLAPLRRSESSRGSGRTSDAASNYPIINSGSPPPSGVHRTGKDRYNTAINDVTQTDGDRR